MQEYNLEKEYFDGLINVFGRALCGKLMKKFEIIENRDNLKASVKETIYEELRAFKQLLDAHAAGREQVSWQFKNKNSKGME